MCTTRSLLYHSDEMGLKVCDDVNKFKLAGPGSNIQRWTKLQLDSSQVKIVYDKVVRNKVAGTARAQTRLLLPCGAD